MLTVASYMKVIPPGNSNPEKPALLKNFITGVNASGDRGIICQTFHPMDTDVAVIQGFVHANSKNVPHLKLRRQVYENQMRREKKCIIVDSNLFLAYDPNNTKTYLRYSYDGIFANTGDYCYSKETVDPKRWDKIAKDLNIQVKPWRMADHGHILIACQRDGGWSMQGQNVLQWLEQTVNKIRKVTDSPIVVRFHPGDKRRDLYPRMIKHLDVIPSTKTTLLHDLQSAKAFVGHNSSPGVIAAIEGVPVFLTDAGRSQAKDVSHYNFNDLLHPKVFDRTEWLQKLAMCHWTLDELKTGECWQHMRKFIK
jgi:hypothetical protein